MNTTSDKLKTPTEAKALVALAFRHGPIENLHSGKSCPTCDGKPGYSRITDGEMKEIMKSAVDQLYRLLRLKIEDPQMYRSEIRRGASHTASWDEPDGARADSLSNEDFQVTPEILNGAVLVTVPLNSADANRHNSGQPYSWERRRNRLEQVLSYIGFTIQHRGIASTHECRVSGNTLMLALIGTDTKAIKTEVLSYLDLVKLPDGSRMAVFTNGSPQPADILLN
jgi:hypothetical protein